MKLHEYQAKELLARHGIPVPRGGVASTPEEAARIAGEVGGRLVVKAQVHAGGRGKAGGIKLVSSPAEAEEAARSMIGTWLVTYQTGPEGVPVGSVLVEEAVDNASELYLGMVIDGSTGGVVAIASEAGGVEIEEVAASTPEKIVRVAIDPMLGLQGYQGRTIAYDLNLDGKLARQVASLVEGLYRAFVSLDCSLVEINPLVVTTDNRALAVDAKVNLDDDALYRHRDLAELRDEAQEDPKEVEAGNAGVSYVKLDGNVGCIVNGAGLAMATMDVVVAAGASPANLPRCRRRRRRGAGREGPLHHPLRRRRREGAGQRVRGHPAVRRCGAWADYGLGGHARRGAADGRPHARYQRRGGEAASGRVRSRYTTGRRSERGRRGHQRIDG